MRNIKGKNYPKWRLDVLFSKKYSNLSFINNGGWHFTCLKTPEELERKLLNFAHHFEFEESGLNINNIKKLILEKGQFMIIMLIKEVLNGLVRLN